MLQKSSACRSGFTLVELVILILTLAILAAVALPRLLNLGRDARLAKVEAIQNSVRAAAQISRAAALLARSTGPAGRVSLDGAEIATAHGYPAATGTAGAQGILAAAGIDVALDKVTVERRTDGSVAIQVNGAPTPRECAVTYHQADPAAAPARPAPVVTALTTGC